MKNYDKILKKLQQRADQMGYAIDNDTRYKELCELITALEYGEIEESEAGNKLLHKWFKELIGCFYPDFEEILEILELLN